MNNRNELLGGVKEECTNPLGMESGLIRDNQLSASSSHDKDSTGPQNSRIRTERGSGAWCPRQQISADVVEWLQIDFDTDMVITAIESQGRFDGGRGLEYAPNYMLEYWRESLGTWSRYKDDKQNEVMIGNSDTQSAVFRELDGGIVARNIRIIPVSEVTRTICMRVELYGCSYKDQLLSYTIPEGDAIDGLNLKDVSYDGITNSSGYLNNGLGKLYDGALGMDNFEKYPEKWIVVQVFKRAHILFSSLGGDQYSPRTLYFNYVPDKNFQTARWVRIPVPSRIAKQLRVELTLPKNSSWLLLSEMKFEFINEVFETNDVEDGELDLAHQTNRGDTLTYFAINDTSEDDTRWISVAIIISLFFLFSALIILFYLLWIYRHTFSRKGPFIILKKNAKDVRMTIEGQTAKRTSPNAYRITNDNMQNSLLEKLHANLSTCSEYAEPNYASSDMVITEGSNKPNVCDPSKFDSNSTIHYASSDIYMRHPQQIGYMPIKNSMTSQIINNYDEVHATKKPANFVEINPQCLRFYERLGNSRFGEVWVCQLEQRTMINKTFQQNHNNCRRDFEIIVSELSSLRHQNILEVIGVCCDGILTSCIHEYIKQYLVQYLQSLNNELSYRTELLLSVSTQIAAGMSYLESKNFIHGNLSACNCLVTNDGTVKLTNFNMAYGLDHFETDEPRDRGRIRWISWEAALEPLKAADGECGKFTFVRVKRFPFFFVEATLCFLADLMMASESRECEFATTQVKNQRIRYCCRPSLYHCCCFVSHCCLIFAPTNCRLYCSTAEEKFASLLIVVRNRTQNTYSVVGLPNSKIQCILATFFAEGTVMIIGERVPFGTYRRRRTNLTYILHNTVKTHKRITIKGDVWSFGVTLWEVLNGCHKYPYKVMADNDMYRNLLFIQQHGTLKLYLERPDFSSISFYQEFMLPCWSHDPEQRPTFHSLHRRLQNVTCRQMSEGCCY
ncbi:Discoidin domain-containing receptor 2 [Dirofilaria immitis]|nr:Discoidin domain-containing receptor 2 [Dirofilaria immitis]